MIPVVGYKTTYPRNRCIAVSYARLLLHDSSLKDHQYRLGLEDTRLCACGQGIEDDCHFFFECTRYTDSRNRLIQAIKDVWSHAGCKGSTSLVCHTHTASSAVIVECFYKSSVSWYINGHFYIHQTDWTSFLNLTDIPWSVQVVVHL